MATTWTFGDWNISNNGLTATSPNTGQGTPSANQGGAINEEFASTAIPEGAKVFYEFQVSGAALYTAFGAGFGELGSNDGGYNPGVVSSNSVPKGAPEMEFSYNLGIAEGQSLLASRPGSPPPNEWNNGAIIGVEVDRVDNTAQFFLNGQSMGTYSIAAMAGETLFPMVSSWFKAGPQATLIADPSDTPAGYTNLADIGQGAPPAPTPPPNPTPPTPPVGNDTITVNQPGTLAVGQDTITGKESDPSQPVFLDWRTFGGAPNSTDGDVVQATVARDGTFSAVVNIDHSDTTSTMYAGTDGALVAQWTAQPSTGPSFIPSPPSGGNTISVNQPSQLVAGMQTFTGSVSDPSQPAFIDFHTYGTPAIDGGDWVQLTPNAQGRFSVSLQVDHAGMQSTVFTHGADGVIHTAFTGTPS